MPYGLQVLAQLRTFVLTAEVQRQAAQLAQHSLLVLNNVAEDCGGAAHAIQEAVCLAEAWQQVVVQGIGKGGLADAAHPGQTQHKRLALFTLQDTDGM